MGIAAAVVPDPDILLPGQGADNPCLLVATGAAGSVTAAEIDPGLCGGDVDGKEGGYR